ncbi:MAG: peptidoglycan-binding domain-containing protein, partial [Nocardioidaceae bacterium]
MVGATLLSLLAAPAARAAPTPAPRILALKCLSLCGKQRLEIGVGGRLQVTARGLGRRSYLVFPTMRRSRHRVSGVRRSSRRLVVRIPGDAASGRVRLRVGRRSSRLAGPLIVRRPQPVKSQPVSGSADAFAGTGMWIWVLARSQGGSPAAIASWARAHRVRTVYVKSSDGRTPWTQFAPTTVAALKAGGLRVCAWQFVYGVHPRDEAALGAAAARAGADCLVIDAEGQYEGRYAQAQTYVGALRAALGADYPLALAGFPYVDYHPAFPFSVFLGPGGAQANLPQMYWRAIGTSVDGVYAHTLPVNRVYGRPIFPLGQLWNAPPAGEVLRFRALAQASGSAGVSWWEWRQAAPSGWSAIAAPFSAAASYDPGWPTLRRGAKGDLIVWAQEHLRGAGFASLAVDGGFGAGTPQALPAFQAARGLPQTGALDPATWPALLAAPVVAPDWASG